MSRWRIKSVSMCGFRSFKDEATVFFPEEESHSVLVRGPISGCGKSTIVMAVAYCLGFTAPPSTELKSWGEKKMCVETRLTDGERILYVRRSPKLRLTLEGKVWEGAAAEEELDKILSLNRSLAEVLTYRAQRKPGSFLSKTDSEKKEFLSTILGLEAVEAASEVVSSSLSSLKANKQTLEQAAAIILPTLRAPADLDQLVAEADSAYGEAKRQAEEARSATDTLPALKRQEQALVAELSKVQNVKAKVYATQAESRSLQSQYKTATEHLDSASKSKCPTCKQHWLADRDSIRSMQDKIEQISEKFRANAAFEKSSSEVLQQERHLNDLLSEVRASAARVSAPAASAGLLVKSALSLLSERTAARDRNAEQAGRVIEIRKKLGDVASKIAVDEHASTILGRDGFLSVIFDEILGEVQERANDMMSRVPNVSRFSVLIDSVAVTKSGSTKKSINTKLLAGGEEVSVAALSGGQRCAVDLCLDLAVSETVRARTGCPLGWIVLDEAMDGLDNSTKQEALAMILSVVKGQVIVIDHATEVQEGFSKVITVSFDGRWSTVL